MRKNIFRRIICDTHILQAALLWLSFSAIAAEPQLEQNQTTTKTVAIFKTMDLALINDAISVYKSQLRQVLPSDTHVEFVEYNAQGDHDRATQIVDSLVQIQEQYDLIISVATLSTNAIVSRSAVWTIPTQFMIVSDPVHAKIVDRLGTTSAFNMTGTSHVIAAQTKLELVNRLFALNETSYTPTIGLLYSDYPSSIASAEFLLSEQRKYPFVRFIPMKYSFASGTGAKQKNHANIIQTLTEYQSQIDGYWIAPGPAAHDKAIYPIIQETLNLPQLFSEDLWNIKQGALFGVISDATIIGRIAASESNLILQGTPANSLPINRSDAFIVAINIATALTLNIVIPSDILTLATEHTYGLQ